MDNLTVRFCPSEAYSLFKMNRNEVLKTKQLNRPFRPHRPLAKIVLLAIGHIFADGFYADKVIERLFKQNRQLGARDRRFIAETVYGVVRWWRLLWETLEMEPSLAESDLWQLFGTWLILEGLELPPWEEFEGLNPSNLQSAKQRALLNPAARESIPDWLYQIGVKELGSDQWHSLLGELNKQAPVVIRANRLKTTRQKLQAILSEQGIETDVAPATQDGLILRERKNVFTSEAFQTGLFVVQDGGSQQIVPLLKLEPGMRVIDACAGAGGKTLHIASYLGNKGKIISMDVHPRKLEELRKRSTRAGSDIIETKLIDSAKVIKRLEKSADRVLLDVPCSGLGVLRRNPDSKWKSSLEEVERLRQLQYEILLDYSQMVKPGGLLVYATCSILPSENENQVAKFLSQVELEPNRGKWQLNEERKLLPGQNDYDGFYAASLSRLS
jgi:16S rRNA (cytosine967-C5)-methyltransferase